MKPLTELETKIYTFIVDYWNSNGFSPSINDISKNLYISRTLAHNYIIKLYEKNYITYVPKIARSITLNCTNVNYKK